MKLHKITGIEKDVCTAEQKIAYNIAFMDYDAINRVRQAEGEGEALQFAFKLRDTHLNKLKEEGSKYNLDAVFCAFNAGIMEYCKAKYHILGNYADIGKAFPILY